MAQRLLTGRSPYLWPVSLLRRQLDLSPMPIDKPGRILGDLVGVKGFRYLAGLFETDLAAPGLGDPVAPVPDWPELDPGRVAVGPGVNRLGFARDKPAHPMRLIALRDVFFAHRGDRFCVFRGAAIDTRSTAIPSQACLVDAAAGRGAQVARMIYCGNRHSPDNPAHFLGDHLTTAALLAKAGYAPSEIFLPATGAPVNRTLQGAVNPGFRSAIPDRLYRVEELLLPTSAVVAGAGHHPFHIADPAILSEFAAAAEGVTAGVEGGGRLLYISRAKAQRRRMVNERDLIGGLRQLGFVSVEMEDLQGPGQLAAVAAADVIIAPHGGALATLFAARPGAAVLELFHPDRGTLAFAAVAARRGLRYEALSGAARDLDRWVIDVEAVRAAALRLMGAGSSP
ncbi:glycosyltransferase family 61 protein [Roseicyclus elongatus]|nr:glycosyltransferase family 61 protein [Roseibacterium elongatum]